MKIRILIGKIYNNCLSQLLVGIGIFLLLSLGLTGGSHWLAANAPVCYWIVAGVVILLLIPLVLLVILAFVGLIVSIFSVGQRKMAKNEENGLCQCGNEGEKMNQEKRSSSRQTQKRKSALKLFFGIIAAAKEKIGYRRTLRWRQIPFVWLDSDAWILTSLLLFEMKPITLAELIFAADWLNHAIPTAYEVNHALTLLSVNGYLTIEADGNIRLTDLSETFKDEAFQKARHFSKIEVVRRNLTQSMTIPCSTVKEYFTDNDMTKAHDAIKQAFKDYTKSRRKKPEAKK